MARRAVQIHFDNCFLDSERVHPNFYVAIIILLLLLQYYYYYDEVNLNHGRGTPGISRLMRWTAIAPFCRKRFLGMRETRPPVTNNEQGNTVIIMGECLMSATRLSLRQNDMFGVPVRKIYCRLIFIDHLVDCRVGLKK